MTEIVSRQASAHAAGNKLRNDEALGRLHVLTISSPAIAALAQNDTIASPVVLPAGSRIIDAIVSHEALGASVTMDIGLRENDVAGTVIDADGIGDGIAVAAAGTHTAANNGVLVDENAPAGYVTTVPSVVYATLLSANPTDDAQFRIDVTVALPG